MTGELADPVDSFQLTLPDGVLVHVSIRPGLEAFLDFCTSCFETHIFTAAESVYADAILDRLDPEGTRFAGRWYREHCHRMKDDGKKEVYVKKLELLPPFMSSTLDRVVLVDNNEKSFLCNPNNGIQVHDFVDDSNDDTLPAVEKLLEWLDDHDKDVKPILQKRIGLVL